MDPLLIALLVGAGAGALGGVVSAVLGWAESETEKINYKKLCSGVIRGCFSGVASALLLQAFSVREYAALALSCVGWGIAGDRSLNESIKIIKRANKSRTNGK